MSTDSVVAFSGSTFRTSPNLWFEDGNIVLRCGEHGFRLYRGLLSKFSAVLSNMFGDASSSGECPIIELGDSAFEFECFVRGLLYPLGFVDKLDDSAPYSAFHILKMCDKYEVGGELRLRALQHLSLLYPTSLDQLYANPPNDLETSYAQFTGGGPDHELVLHLRIIKLATDIHLPWMLPFALYKCAILASTSQLIDGVSSADSTTPVRLDAQHLKLCLELQRRGSLAGDLGLVDHVLQNIPECSAYPGNYHQSTTHWGHNSTVTCPKGRAAILQQVLSRSLLDIATSEQEERLTWEGLGICDKCVANMEVKYRKGRESFWSKLPTHLGLSGGWDALLRAKRQALYPELFEGVTIAPAEG